MARSRAARAEGREASDTKERILEAALEAFAERGFEGATTRDIAGRADVNLGLIKYYFGDKLSLWKAAVDRAFAGLFAELGPALEEAGELTDAERLELLLRRATRYVGRHPEFVRLMNDEGKRKGSRMRWLVDRHVKPMYDAVEVLLLRARGRGVYPAHIEPVHFHYAVIGALGLFFHAAEEVRRLTGVDPTDESAIEAHADTLVFLFGPRQETP